MPRALRVIRSRLNRGVLLWGSLSVVFGIGALYALITLLPAPKAEIARASAATQRLTIDATTSVVTGLAKKTEAETPPATLPDASAATTPATTAGAQTTADAPSATPATATKLATQPATETIPTIAAGNDSIVSPPAKEITEKTHDFLLPKRAGNDTSASSLYAKNFAPKKETKLVSVVLIDAGMNAQTLAQILQLPHGVTVAFSPYAPDANATIMKLHEAGFETWGMLPTMGTSYPQRDPGPLGIITSLPPEENIRRLHQVMANTLGAVGLVLPLDETLSAHTKVFAPLVEDITTRGLYLLSTRPEIGMDTLTGKNAALEPSIQRAQVILDANATNAEIQSKLDGLQAMLNSRSGLILIVPARAQMLGLLSDWLNHGGLGPSVEIAPLSVQYKLAAPATPAIDAGKDAEKKPASDAKPADAKTETKPAAKPDEKPAAPAASGAK